MRILCIEDDTALTEIIGFHLKEEGYEIDFAYTGLDGLILIKEGAYDLILLDCMLPELDGISVLKKIRNLSIFTPVLMITALDGIDDRVNGLDAGADDYLIKPFATKELLARVRALSRRPNQMAKADKIKYQDITLDLLGLALEGPVKTCSLSKREALLIEVFLRHPNEPLTREFIFAKVWGPTSEVEDGNLDNYIHFVRRRLKSIGSHLQVKTLRSVGYKLEMQNA
ncbi:MAG: response regulator transcription factor [Cellulosilyticum sp.]|nr:response regulator transcription factor [Cellulosilyticum sp.]